MGRDFFLFATTSIQTLGPIQSPIEWMPGALSSGIKWPGRDANHSHLVLRLRMPGVIPSIPVFHGEVLS